MSYGCISSGTVLFKPQLAYLSRAGIQFCIDKNSPNWIAVDRAGECILKLIDGKKTVDQLVLEYYQQYRPSVGLVQLFDLIYGFLSDALRDNIISLEPVTHPSYLGRSHCLSVTKLKEFWIHLTQTCNLSCNHCLVSSSPSGEKGQNTDFYKRIIDETSQLGTECYYFTGGEPFVRTDIFDLIHYVTEEKKKELVILTNATLFSLSKIEKLKQLNKDLLRFQVSLDGTTQEINDSIRGDGVFVKTSEGLKILNQLGFRTTLTAVVTKQNIDDLGGLAHLAKDLGSVSVHLMWLHKRGRILEQTDFEPSNSQLFSLFKKLKISSRALGITFDNFESLKKRVIGYPGVKYDLSLIGWESLCMYMDGSLYPSAAMAGCSELVLGNVLGGESIQSIWECSTLLHTLRQASVIHKSNYDTDPLCFLTGGGDVEHAYFFSKDSDGSLGNFNAMDPYYCLHVDMIKDAMCDVVDSHLQSLSHANRMPFSVLYSMGSDALSCSEDAQDILSRDGDVIPVKLLHSNCVLIFDLEKPYKAVRKFYGDAADVPSDDLCCPIKYDQDEIGHIPKDVIDRFYGCGSPISFAYLQEGECVLDLGSGAGIDCFIAAKKVGSQGSVYGVDMTDNMLAVANRCKKTVSDNLGYNVVTFKKGYLEDIPQDDSSVDLVTSNCVVNLSPDKRKVFREVWRILKNGARFVIADIVCNQDVPVSLQAHQSLWGECISGSLSEDRFISYLKDEGFIGIKVLKKVFWKKVEGYDFYSVIVRGFKFHASRVTKEKTNVIYLGPYKSVVLDHGHVFFRNQIASVDSSVANQCISDAYKGSFAFLPSSICGDKSLDFSVQEGSVAFTSNTQSSDCCSAVESSSCC